MSFALPPDTLPSRSSGRVAGWLLFRSGAVLGLAAAMLVAVFLAGVPVSGEFLRVPLEKVLSKTFGVPTRIEGPLSLHTGWITRAEFDALTLEDTTHPDRLPLARAVRPVVRMDLGALLHQVIHLDEVAAETLTLRLARTAEGRGNWEVIGLQRQGGGNVTFAGIDSLRIGKLEVSYHGADGNSETRGVVTNFEGVFMMDRPMMVQGNAQLGGQAFSVKLRSASLAQLGAGGKSIPIHAELHSAFAQLKMDGTYVPSDTVLDAVYDFSAPDADAVLKIMNVTSKNAGMLNSRGHVRATASSVAVNNLAVRLGDSELSGNLSMALGVARPKLSFDLSATRMDLLPFAQPQSAGEASVLETFVTVLDRAASGMDLHARMDVAEFVLAEFKPHDVRIEARSADGHLNVKAQAALWNMDARLVLAYDARKPGRVLTGKIESGHFSTTNIPRQNLQSDISATVADLRGQIRGQGASVRDIAASLHGNLTARNLHLTWSRAADQRMDIRLASARVGFGGGKPVLADIRGRFGGQACVVKGTGGTVDALLVGKHWPVRLDLSCAASRLSARGHVDFKGSVIAVEGNFDGGSDNVRTTLATFGLRSTASFPASLKGQFGLDERTARIKLEQMNIGRTAGNGQVLWAYSDKSERNVVLALTNADFDELWMLAEPAGSVKPAEMMAREVLPANLRLPDVDFELTADAVHYAGENLRKFRLKAAPSGSQLLPVDFAFDWHGGTVTGKLQADFRGAQPGIELNLTAQGAVLNAVFARAGLQKTGFSAGALNLNAKAKGVLFGELLASTVGEATFSGGRLDNTQRFVPGLSGSTEFSADFRVVSNGPAALTVQGKAAGTPLEFVIKADRLSELARPGGGIPLTLHASLGDVTLEASGNVKPDGTGDARVRMAGQHLHDLGGLAGVVLPEIGSYSATANVVATPDFVSFSGLDVLFGKSRVLGSIRSRRAARPDYDVDLRSPALHLEELGIDFSEDGAGKTAASETSSAKKPDEAGRVVQLQRVLRSFDAKVKMEIESLHVAGLKPSRLAGHATLTAGDLRLDLQGVQGAGGTATANIRIEADKPRPRLQLNALTENYEYDWIVRIFDPKSALAGTLDLSLDLSTAELSPPSLFADMQGRVEMAFYPRNLRLGAANLWGAGLLSVVQSKLDLGAESVMNCSVSVWSFEKGVARTEAFFGDTTRVRIVGGVEVEVVGGYISGQLSPRAKNPELFSIDPSITLSGTLSSPKIAVTPRSLITSSLRLALPLHSYAMDWLSGRGSGVDGVAGCREAFERARSAGSKPAATVPQ